MATAQEHAPGHGVRATCAALGISRATYYRQRGRAGAPSGPKARRIEHRVAGADANPYLVLASILGGALLGIEGKWKPPLPVSGDAYSQNLETLPPDWASAIEAFSRGPHVTQIYARRLQRMFVQCKVQELRRFTRHVTEFEYHSYLEAV